MPTKPPPPQSIPFRPPLRDGRNAQVEYDGRSSFWQLPPPVRQTGRFPFWALECEVEVRRRRPPPVLPLQRLKKITYCATVHLDQVEPALRHSSRQHDLKSTCRSSAGWACKHECRMCVLAASPPVLFRGKGMERSFCLSMHETMFQSYCRCLLPPVGHLPMLQDERAWSDLVALTRDSRSLEHGAKEPFQHCRICGAAAVPLSRHQSRAVRPATPPRPFLRIGDRSSWMHVSCVLQVRELERPKSLFGKAQRIEDLWYRSCSPLLYSFYRANQSQEARGIRRLIKPGHR
jgi:hypothetical protein